jgi:phosphate-selective porin OprO/OprP
MAIPVVPTCVKYIRAANRSKIILLLFAAIPLLIAMPCKMYGQDIAEVAHDDKLVPRDSTITNKLEAGDEADVMQPKRQLVRFNEYQGKIFSVKLGGGFLQDAATYIQDNKSEEQVSVGPFSKLRDFRVTFKGRFGPRKMKYPVTYTTGIMYDAPSKKWLFRETGIMVGIPQLHSHIFFGRTKEGFSLNKVMVGYAGWTMERSTMSDATVPILGDGIKWYGFLPKPRIVWNIGYFFDKYNEDQAFSTYDNQGVARIAWLPILSEPRRTVLHIGVNLRQGNVDKDTLQLRSRPESWTATYFVDTKKFPATQTFMCGWEAYYRKGPWLFGTEYWFVDVNSPGKGNPTFHGGDIVASWLITGETREYNTAGGFFRGISPARTIFEGGLGAIEAVLRLSYIDLDDAKIQGGKFWRITPMVNLHLSDNIRLEFAYGYGQLQRFNLTGGTQFFQTRLQLQL